MIIDWENCRLIDCKPEQAWLMHTTYHLVSLYLLSNHRRFISLKAFLYVWPRLTKEEQKKMRRLIRNHMEYFYAKRK